MSDWRLTLTRVELDESEIVATLDALRSGWLTMGPRTQELEEAFREATGSAHAVAVSSASAALHLSCIAAGVGPGDEVIAPALSFVADAHAGRLAGGATRLADCVALEEPLLGAGTIEPLIGARTKAVIAVHMFGYPVDLGPLAELCAERRIVLIEDCAQAAGGRLRDGRPAGTAGLAGCFSFFAKTQLGVGEGGIVVTDDERFAARLRSLRSHAMTSVTWDRHRGHAETYDVTELGFNYRLDEPRAALARARLRRLPQTLEGLRTAVSGYRERLAGKQRVTVPFADGLVAPSGHFAFPVLVGDREVRDRARDRMHAAGVQTTFYPSITRLSEYAGADPCPVAEEFADRHLALPLAASLTADDLDLAVGTLLAALD